MEILLFRHGIAEPARPGQPDAERSLTDRGRSRTALAASGLARVADRPDAILSSPKVRAFQTAAIVGEVYDMAPQLVDVLADGPPSDIVRTLRDRRERHLLLVGHEPWMSHLIELLCAERSPHGFVELKKAAAAMVSAPIGPEEPPGPGTLHWLLPPRVLRELASVK